MILSKILGGLGNQMFCYAAGRATALRNEVELKLDVTGYPDNDGRVFELDRFDIQKQIASDDELANFRKHDATLPWNKIVRKALCRSYGQTKNFRQRGFAFDPEFLKIGPHCRLDGLFQSELFFQHTTREIRRDFQLREEHIDQANRLHAGQMRSSESVSLHVRRTDYVQHAHYSKIVEPCSVAYYQQALAIIQQRLQNPHVFVFSDDPDWCRAHLDLPASATVIDHNGPDKPWLDMHLMSSCKHHIIANSTFSWWGAWLAEWDGQIVIAPKQWYRNDSNLDYKDIVPTRWIRI
jgi:hypothetical protein